MAPKILENLQPFKRKRLYLPKIMTDLIWALTTNSTKVHFNESEVCVKHN